MFKVWLTGLTVEQLSCLVFLRLICVHWLPLSEMHMFFFFSQYSNAGAVISPGTEQALHSCCPPTVFANHSLVIMPCFRRGQTGRPLSREGNVTCKTKSESNGGGKRLSHSWVLWSRFKQNISITGLRRLFFALFWRQCRYAHSYISSVS